jgi:hypothetical protein
MRIARPSLLSWREGSRGRAGLVLLGLAAVLGLLWASSYWANFGVGVGAGSRPQAVFVEVTTVTDGLLIVRDGTRTDNICYDGPTGYEYGPSDDLYLLTIDKACGPHVWWPRVEHPAPWCGPYIFVPLWMPILVCLALGCAVGFRRRSPPGTCEACRYPLAGMPPGAACPECGTAASAA